MARDTTRRSAPARPSPPGNPTPRRRAPGPCGCRYRNTATTALWRGSWHRFRPPGRRRSQRPPRRPVSRAFSTPAWRSRPPCLRARGAGPSAPPGGCRNWRAGESPATGFWHRRRHSVRPGRSRRRWLAPRGQTLRPPWCRIRCREAGRRSGKSRACERRQRRALPGPPAGSRG